MQDFGTKTDNSPPPGGQLSAAEFNNLATENEIAVTRSGQSLDGGRTNQLAESLFIHAVKSVSFQDSGSANAYVATPVSGSSGVLIPGNYTNLNGAVITFIAANSNTGASTLNIGQTTGTLIGSKPIRFSNDAALASGDIKGGTYLTLRYDASLGGGSGAWAVVSSIGVEAHGVVRFVTPGVTAWPVPAAMQLGIIRPKVTVVGGGGSGSRLNAAAAGGGGAAGAAIGILDLTGVTSVTVTVGAGGAATTAEGAGNTGASSSFGAFLSATGGQAAPAQGGGGDGGAGVGGNLLNPSGSGGSPAAAGVSSGRFSSGAGGSSIFSGGGRGRENSVAVAGVDGNHGGGGGGGVLTGNSGKGGDGVVIIEW